MTEFSILLDACTQVCDLPAATLLKVHIKFVFSTSTVRMFSAGPAFFLHLLNMCSMHCNVLYTPHLCVGHTKVLHGLHHGAWILSRPHFFPTVLNSARIQANQVFTLLTAASVCVQVSKPCTPKSTQVFTLYRGIECVQVFLGWPSHRAWGAPRPPPCHRHL